ncbi:MAG: hypothetical protein KDD62_03860 [Bdellovibrionales bacterium]|nr:hypothetical protein [Bdellovibrionales bacterium]
MEQLLPDLSGLLYVIVLGAFVKIATALSIFKQGLGLQGMGFSLAIVGFAFVLSMFVMNSQVADLEFVGKDLQSAEQQLVPFFEKHADPELKTKFDTIRTKMGGADNVKARNSALSAAFLVSELKEAFNIGLLILLPFVVIDLLVANTLVLLGITQFSHLILSLPLKLLLFIGVDGWTLLSDKLLQGYL